MKVKANMQDIHPDKMAIYENEFRESNEREEEEDFEYINRFLGFIRGKDHFVYLINRPENSINVIEPF